MDDPDVVSSDVGCQIELHTVDGTYVDMSQCDYPSDKSQSQEHGIRVDRYQMLSILAHMPTDGSLLSVSSSTDTSAFSAQ